jgi:hypothetical protein
MLPVLRRWAGRPRITTNYLYARLMGARMRLGDGPLLRAMRRKLGRRNAAVPVNPEKYVAGLGAHVDDIPALIRFAGASSPEGRMAYDAIDRLIAMLKGKAAGSINSRAMRRLAVGLSKLTAYRENRARRTFSYSLLSRHHASLAALGVAGSKRRLLALIRSRAGTASSWVAAERALKLGLPGAKRAVAALMARGIRTRGRGVLRKYKRRLIMRAAAVMGRGHAGWTAMLMDWNVNERNLALYHFARVKPPGACRVVASVVNLATRDGVHDGLVALSLLGTRCRPEVEKLARNRKTRPEIRGTALEVLAMMRAPAVAAIARAMENEPNLYKRRRLRVYARRALQIAAVLAP